MKLLAEVVNDYPKLSYKGLWEAFKKCLQFQVRMEPTPTENLWLQHVHQLPNLGMASVCTSPALKETNYPACWAALVWSNSVK